jgi:parallel beta-helix repeat protein
VVLDGDDTKFAGFLLEDAHGNLIEGFVVQNYHEAGILLAGSSGNTIRKNVTTGSPHHDGIQVADSPENVVEHNRSFANTSAIACGINVIGPESARNIVRHNETFENQFGIQVAVEAANNVIFHNESHDNRGIGIRNIVGSNGTLIENNRVLNNVLRGISVTLGSSGVLVARNKAFNNDAADLFWDMTGAAEFENNHCRFSVPPGLCEHPEGASKE